MTETFLLVTLLVWITDTRLIKHEGSNTPNTPLYTSSRFEHAYIILSIARSLDFDVVEFGAKLEDSIYLYRNVRLAETVIKGATDLNALYFGVRLKTVENHGSHGQMFKICTLDSLHFQLLGLGKFSLTFDKNKLILV